MFKQGLLLQLKK